MIILKDNIRKKVFNTGSAVDNLQQCIGIEILEEA